jgi:hypothetical protein
MSQNNNEHIRFNQKKQTSSLDNDLLTQLIKDLHEFNQHDSSDIFINEKQCYVLPSRDVIVDIVEELRTILFPIYFAPSDLHSATISTYVRKKIDDVFQNLKQQIKRGYM